MRRLFLKYLAAAAFGAALFTGAAYAAEPVKVVYHLSEGNEQATRALANIRNHLRADPDVKIVVVALGDGIRFLLKDAQDASGKPYQPQVVALAEQGVQFRVCNNTLSAHQVPASKVIPQASIVPSGVAEVARLQAREGYVYLRP
jgi:hypothetical protein